MLYKDLTPENAVSVINDIMKSSKLTDYEKCKLVEQLINEDIDTDVVWDMLGF